MFDLRIPDLKRFEGTVHTYEQQPIEWGRILFYGDSSFTRWNGAGIRPLEQSIRRKDGSSAVINHAFGGATSEELLYYYNRLVKPWAPRAMVFCDFGNDAAFNYSATEMLYLQSRIFAYARQDMPGIKLYLCDRRPVAKKFSHSIEMRLREYNDMLQDYCAKHDDCTFVSHAAYAPFFESGNTDRYPIGRKELYVEDDVHFNQIGYDLYAEFFRQVLDQLL